MRGITTMNSSKKIILTGATGLIGKEVLPLLKKKKDLKSLLYHQRLATYLIKMKLILFLKLLDLHIF